MEVRKNLVIFGIGLMMLVFIITIFAILMLGKDGIVPGNEEMIIVGIFGLLNAVVAGAIGYAVGVQQALTSPSDPPPTVTEQTMLEVVKQMREEIGTERYVEICDPNIFEEKKEMSKED